MKKVYYEKVGDKYIPVKEYDSDLMDALPYGDHLFMVRKNITTKRYFVEPAFAPMIAAGLYATEVISKHIVKASDIRPSKNPMTEKQINAWKALSEAFGEECHRLEWPSAYEAAIEATTALQDEATKLLSRTSVKNAYDEFMLICKLALEEK